MTAAGITTIPVHSRTVFILPSGAKKNDHYFDHYFALDLVIILAQFGV